jgi:hypothetical protein
MTPFHPSHRITLSSLALVAGLAGCMDGETEPVLATDSAAVSSQAYSQCDAILARGVHDRWLNTSSSRTAGVLTDWSCDKLNRSADADTQWNWGYMQSIMGVDGDFSFEEAREYCETRQRPYEASSFTYYALTEVANTSVVNAWRDCVTQKNRGFVCEPQKQGSNTLFFNLSWDTQDADTQLDLTWPTRDNVTALGSLPTSMGEGDTGADFRITNTSRTASIRVTATGDRPGGGTFQRSCVVAILPPPPAVTPPTQPDREHRIIGVGNTNFGLWLKRQLNFGWEDVPGSGGIMDVTVMKDGTLLGVGNTNHALWTRRSVDPSHAWVSVPNSGGVRSVAVMKDGTILGVGITSFSLWTKSSLTADWVGVANSGGIRDVAIMPDGTILGVGETSYSLWTKASLTADWVSVPNSGGIRSVDVKSDGTIIGVGNTSFSLWTKSSLTASWVGVPNSGGVQSVAVGSVKLE